MLINCVNTFTLFLSVLNVNTLTDLAAKATANEKLTTGQVALKIDNMYVCECSNDCTAIPIMRTIIDDDDRWRGCPKVGCSHFYCAKINCQKKISSSCKIVSTEKRLSYHN